MGADADGPGAPRRRASPATEDRRSLNGGPGIAPQLLEKIFEPFQSHFEGGTGLGLAIVYQVIQAHKAAIGVESQPGKGAEFVLELLQANAGAEEATPQIVAAGVAHG